MKFKDKASSSFLDLTTPITENLVTYPGDPVFEKKSVASADGGCAFNLCQISVSNHFGTHVDYPAHVISGGKTSSDYSLDHLVGSGLVIQVPPDLKTITAAFVGQQNIVADDIVFFKTNNSTHISKQQPFEKDYVYIEPGAAAALIKFGVQIVGIDYISVDAFSAPDLPVHHLLLSNEILIVENLELAHAEPGRGKIYIMPLNVPDMDGLPVRVMMTV